MKEKENNYKCPEIENMKKETDKFFKEAEEFIEKQKKGEK